MLQSNRQSRCVHEATKQGLATRCLAGGQKHARVQLLDVLGAVVGQRAAFEVRPSVFIGIEFGGISGQVFEMDPTGATQPSVQEFAAVGLKVVPHNDDRPSHVPKQLAKELDNLILPDRSIQVELQIPSQSMSSRRHRQTANARDAAMMPDAVAQDWRLPARRPGSLHQRLQEKACFVDENQVRMVAGRPALDPRPVVRQPVRNGCLVTLQSATFGLLRGKNPARPSDAEWRRRDTALGTDAPRPVQSADRSKGRSRSRRPSPLSEDNAPDRASAWASTWPVARMQAEPAGPLPRAADAVAATSRPSGAWSQEEQRSGWGLCPVDSTQRPGGVAAPTAAEFHVVSCFITSALLNHKDYFYRTQ